MISLLLTASAPPESFALGISVIVYIGADSNDDGSTFRVIRRERDVVGTRRGRITGDGRGYFDVDLEYVLRTWLLMEPEPGEKASSSDLVRSKILVLYCVFLNSAKWCRTLEAWNADPASRPIKEPEWSFLSVRIIGRDDAGGKTVVAKMGCAESATEAPAAPTAPTA